ncbi:hypothetical protein QJS10_CPB04g01348 [Acorus calamus]|uniref:peptidyl-tRNA hydrolase n=1 Tax=Acorus calamus TaxID=4465 RepID=A0AAV9F236_ACOCL|nr:hypothetical protein QJS10_CPB04g01348 [Acorus calamus]
MGLSFQNAVFGGCRADGQRNRGKGRALKSKHRQPREHGEAEEVVLQYVVLRRDLIDSWPFGSIVTQGCHASVAAVWAYKDDALVEAKFLGYPKQAGSWASSGPIQ